MKFIYFLLILYLTYVYTLSMVVHMMENICALINGSGNIRGE